MAVRIIDVTFIDAATGQTFLKLKLPERQLPASFDAATTLNLGKDDWQVVSADPVTGFAERGALTLTLRKLTLVNPKDILFSLPTVADEVPKTTAGARPPLLRLAEDDWLQLELIPVETVPAAQPDLDAVANVLATARKGPGFERLHVRKALPAPFAARALKLDALTRRYGTPGTLAWHGSAEVLEGGFAFGVPGGGLYGTARDGDVTALGLDRASADVTALRRDERLALVDWCAANLAA